MAEITLKGRKIPLVYMTYEMKLVQEEVAPLGDVNAVLFGKNVEDENDTSQFGAPRQLEAIGKMIRIMGNAGLEDAGEKPDLTDRWVLRALKPTQIVEAITACVQAMNEGMESEIKPENSNEPVDVTLEAINKKKEQGS